MTEIPKWLLLKSERSDEGAGWGVFGEFSSADMALGYAKELWRTEPYWRFKIENVETREIWSISDWPKDLRLWIPRQEIEDWVAYEQLKANRGEQSCLLPLMQDSACTRVVSKKAPKNIANTGVG